MNLETTLNEIVELAHTELLIVRKQAEERTSGISQRGLLTTRSPGSTARSRTLSA